MHEVRRGDTALASGLHCERSSCRTFSKLKRVVMQMNSLPGSARTDHRTRELVEGVVQSDIFSHEGHLAIEQTPARCVRGASELLQGLRQAHFALGVSIADAATLLASGCRIFERSVLS
jgi:hypothetical protein